MNLNHPIDSASELADAAKPLFKEVASQASELAQQGAARLRDEAQDLSLQAQGAKLAAIRCIRNEPVKSMLVAAATGAALMALFSLLGHARQGRDSSR